MYLIHQATFIWRIKCHCILIMFCEICMGFQLFQSDSYFLFSNFKTLVSAFYVVCCAWSIYSTNVMQSHVFPSGLCEHNIKCFVFSAMIDSIPGVKDHRVSLSAGQGSDLRVGSGILMRVLYRRSSLCSSMKCFSFLLTIQVKFPCLSFILNTAGIACEHSSDVRSVISFHHCF